MDTLKTVQNRAQEAGFRTASAIVRAHLARVSPDLVRIERTDNFGAYRITPTIDLFIPSVFARNDSVIL